MKPFLGIDITENKKNEQYNGQEFIVASASAAQAQALEKASEDAVEILKQYKFPVILHIVQWACLILAIVFVRGIVDGMTGEDSVTLAQAYQNAGWAFWAAGALLLGWLVLLIINRKKGKALEEDEENNRVFNKIDVISKNIEAEFGVPADAARVDVLSFSYKLQQGEPVAKQTDSDITAYINQEMRAYVEDGLLHLTDVEHKYVFALSQMKRIRTVQKRIEVPMWNKDEPHNKGIYKPYKIKEDDVCNISFKPYHVLELEHEGQLWGIYFPCYELPVFEALTGLKAIT